LIIAGEWMPVIILKFSNGKFEDVNAVVAVNLKSIPLNQLNGWWNVVKADDIDNDGDLDLMVGNRGTNSKIAADIDEPCTVYAKDFDGNGSYDAVLGYYIWGKCYPMYHRDQLIDQMPMMRKKFTDDQKKGMDVFKTNWFESGVLINDGNFKFRFVAFPEQAQFSTINDLIISDFNGDGKKDIFTGGNSYNPDVSTGNYDARAAQFLTGDDKGNFQTILPLNSGLDVNGEVRRIIYLQETKKIILLKNNAPAQLLQQN
jgi:enediyne biosynthesis protein E4